MTILTFTKLSPDEVHQRREEYLQIRPLYIQHLAQSGKLDWLPPKELSQAKETGEFRIASISIHHLVPLSMGGTNDFTNMMPLPYWSHNRIHFEYDQLTKNLQVGESIQVEDLSEKYKDHRFIYIKSKKAKKGPPFVFTIPQNSSITENYEFNNLSKQPNGDNLLYLPPKNRNTPLSEDDLYIDAETIASAFWFDSFGNIRLKSNPEYTKRAVAEMQRIGIDVNKFYSMRGDRHRSPYFFLKTNNEEKKIIQRIQKTLLRTRSDEIFEEVLNYFMIDGDYSLVLRKQVNVNDTKDILETLSSLGFTGERVGKRFIPKDEAGLDLVKGIYEFAVRTGKMPKRLPLSALTIKALTITDKAEAFTL